MSWYKDFKLNFNNYIVYYKENFNQELKDRWISLILKDKFFNWERCHAYREGRIKITIEELVTEASEISKEFENIIERYGFPHEHQMGYLYIQGQNRVSDYRMDVVIIHIYQRGETIYENDIDKFVCDGNLRSNKNITKESIGFWYGIGLKNVMTKFYNRYSKD
ncbi:MAG: hypothetical protein QNK89_02555 [Lacinutrix sp.]|uniref:hypothetical protein n=1 Tax=Lacinutrix sp. TaxID=1937692 RepID=UPI0030A5C270